MVACSLTEVPGQHPKKPVGSGGVACSSPPLFCPDSPSARQVVFHDLETLAQKLQPTVEALQKLFSAGAGSYYGDSLFFLSVAMHHIMPRGEWALGASVPLLSLLPLCSSEPPLEPPHQEPQIRRSPEGPFVN